MANESSVARPYAKALFDYALEHKSLAAWSKWLACLAQLSSCDSLRELIKNPSLSPARLTEILVAIARELDSSSWLNELESLLALLVTNKRISALGEIFAQFDLLREQQEKTLAVDVSCFTPLSSTQVTQLSERLSQRFARKVTLNQTIDPLLLGGVVIRAHDIVIDGSIRGQLIKLSADLAT